MDGLSFEELVMKNTINRLGNFALRYPALLSGLLVGSALVSAFDRSIFPAILQAACALTIACSIKR
jgi:hypothetical protein